MAKLVTFASACSGIAPALRGGAMSAVRALVIGLLAASACGCGDEDDEPRAWLSPPTVAGRRLALVDTAQEQLRLFDVAAARNDSLPSLAVDLPQAPYAIWAREGARHDLLIAARGEREGDEAPLLALIEPNGDSRLHRLAAPYTALAQTEDGRYAVAHFAPGARDVAASAAQLAVIDLDARDAASEVGFELDGQPWSELWLTPALPLDGGALHLAVASFERHVGVLALEHPQQRPQFVALTGDERRAARASDLVWLPSQARVALIAQGLDDLFVLTLQSSSDARGHALDVAQFAAGSSPTALALAEPAQTPVLLVLAGAGRELRVLDPGSGEGPLLDLDEPASAIAACSPSCAHALLYAPGASSATLVDAALAAVGDPEALHPLRLSGPIARVTIANDQSHAYCVHADGSLTWIDLEAGTLQAVALGRADASAVQLAEDGSVWIAPAGQDLVTWIEPASRARAQVQLDAPVGRLVLVPEAGRAVVIHDGARLALSVLDGAAPAHDTVVYVEDLP
jgi:hypothetical protein